MAQRIRSSSRARQGGLSRRAFTLLEILIVLVLITLMAALAMPALDSQLTASEMPESAARMRDALYMTRSAAMLEHRRHRIRFAPNEQQPYFEIEIDPIFQPGVWTPVAYPWAEETILLEDVQVSAIQPGRPIYLKPVSATEDAEGKESQEAAQEELRLDVGVTDGQQIGSIGVAQGNDEAEFDPNRPPIVFETDGSSDWATIILSQLELGQALDDEIHQLWIVLDGRTGLATVREQVTQEQLADPDFYVQKEKLELPEEVTPEDLTLQIATDESGNLMDPSMQPPQGDGALDPLTGGAAVVPPDGQLPQGVDPSMLDPANLPANGQTDPNQADAEAGDNLEEGLQNSDLTEEEREKIRKALSGGGSR